MGRLGQSVGGRRYDDDHLVGGKEPMPQSIQLVKALIPSGTGYFRAQPQGFDEKHCWLIELILLRKALEHVPFAARELVCFAEIDE